jgi:hypothetical protein
MNWILVERETYVRMCDENCISDEVREQVRAWAPTFQNTYQLARQKKVYWSPRNTFEIWSVGIPNPDANKGKSGGFRVVLFLDLVGRTINLDFIEPRDEIGYKQEAPKKKDKYQRYVEALKNALTEKDSQIANGKSR